MRLASNSTDAIPVLSIKSMSSVFSANALPALFPFSVRAALRAGTLTLSDASPLWDDSGSLGHTARFARARLDPMAELQMTVLFQDAIGHDRVSAQYQSDPEAGVASYTNNSGN